LIYSQTEILFFFGIQKIFYLKTKMINSRKKAVLIYILVSLFLCFEMGVQVSPSVMTGELMQDLHLDSFYLGLMSGLYFYTYTLMQIPAGLLFDRFNIRYVIILPLLICSLGVYLFSISGGLWSASFARLLMGGGSAFAFIAVLVIASEVFPRQYFATLAGITQMLAAFGAMSSELVLTPFINFLGWRQATQVIALAGIALALFIWIFVRYRRANIVGENTHSYRESLQRVILKKQTWLIASYAFLLWAPMAAFASLWGVPYLTHAYSLSNIKAAEAVSLMWLGIAFASPLLGLWSDRCQSRTIPLTVSALVGLISFLVIIFAFTDSKMILITMLLLAGGACSGQALTFAVIKDISQKSELASAIGFNNMAVVVAGAIFQPLTGWLIHFHSAKPQITPYTILTTSDYRFGLIVILLCYLFGLILSSFFIKETLPLNFRKLFKRESE